MRHQKIRCSNRITFLYVGQPSEWQMAELVAVAKQVMNCESCADTYNRANSYLRSGSASSQPSADPLQAKWSLQFVLPLTSTKKHVDVPFAATPNSSPQLYLCDLAIPRKVSPSRFNAPHDFIW